MRLIGVSLFSVIFLCIGVIMGVFVTIYNAYRTKEENPDTWFVFGMTLRLLDKFIRGGEK